MLHQNGKRISQMLNCCGDCWMFRHYPRASRSPRVGLALAKKEMFRDLVETLWNRETLAGRSNDQFWNSACPGENRRPRHARNEEALVLSHSSASIADSLLSLETSESVFSKQVILESLEVPLA
jgi:hypothetical protein